MAIEILMPALSPTMEEGTLAKWLVKAGDKVKSGQIIAEIETDKATMEVEAVDEGEEAGFDVRLGAEAVMIGHERLALRMRSPLMSPSFCRRLSLPSSPARRFVLCANTCGHLSP